MGSVLVGSSLHAFVAANAAALGSMVTISGGTSMVGSADCFENEQPLHEVTVSTFQMGVHPVTNEEHGDLSRRWKSGASP